VAISSSSKHHGYADGRWRGEPVENGYCDVTESELVAAFSHLATSTIGNVLDELGRGGLIVNLKPLVKGRPFCGVAVTARESTGAFGSRAPEAMRRYDTI